MSKKETSSEDIPTSIVVSVYFFVFTGLAFFAVAVYQKSFVGLIPGTFCWIAAILLIVLIAMGEVAREANKKRNASFEEIKSRMDKFKDITSKGAEDIFGKNYER